MSIMQVLVCWLYFVVIFIPQFIYSAQDVGSIRTTITGSTGVLGQAICKSLASRNVAVLASYRDRIKAEAFLQCFKNSQPRSGSQFKLFPFDIPSSWDRGQTDFSLGAFLSIPGFGTCSQCQHSILVNNAAICSSTIGIKSLQQHLAINAYMPIKLGEHLISSHQRSMNKSPSRRGSQLSIINISSGDGELVYLHSAIVRDIESITSLEDYYQYFDLVTSYQLDDEQFQFAHSPTPYYSISKALLNLGTILLHNSIAHHDLVENCRSISCCPGNFASAMSSDEELQSLDFLQNPTSAAEDIVDVALDFNRYQSGYFYRNRKLIPW